MNNLVKKFVLALVVWLAVLPFNVYAQVRSGYSWEQFVEDYSSFLDEGEEGSANSVERSDWLEELEEIHCNPIDINTAERGELQALHFLTDEQIDSLLVRRNRYVGGLRSLGELMTVRELSYRDRAWLSLFLDFKGHKPEPADSVAIGKDKRRTYPTFGNKWYGGIYEAIGTVDIPLYRKAGFYDYDAHNYPTKMFTGYNFAHSLRVHYNWKQRVRYGATVQQDIGERFGAYGSRPWDYQSFHFYCKSDPQRVGEQKFNRWTIAVGDYRVSLGEGLLMGGNSWNARMGLLHGCRLDNTVIRPHTSTDEMRFLRGLATTVRLGRKGQWSASAFGSWRRVDGTVKGANAANGFSSSASDTITAWKTDGLHRTLQEIGKRSVATQCVVGGRVGYAGSWLNMGINAVWLHYDKVYAAASRAYNKYYMSGHDAGGVSLDYSVRRRQWGLKGELAFDRKGHCASSWMLRWHPLRSLTLACQQRSFSRAYVSPYGRTLQAGSQLQNEHGGMLGISYTGLRRLTLNGYVDLAYHPSAVYLADAPSHRIEVSAEATYNALSDWSHTLRYSMKTREQNVTGYKDIPDFDDVLMSWRATQHLRWQSVLNRKAWSVTAGGDAACYFSQGESYNKASAAIKGHGTKWGGLAFVRCSYGLVSRLKVAGMLACYYCQDYKACCYAYVPQLRGSVSVPSFSGQGILGAVTGECRVWNQLYAACRLTTVKYFDRDAISSGVNLINSSWKTDLSVQLRYRLEPQQRK